MKNFVTFTIFAIVVAFFAIFGTLTAEITDLMKFVEKDIPVEFENKGDELFLSWQPLPVPGKYKVETFYKTTGLVAGAPEYHLLDSSETEGTSFKIPGAAIPVYYFVSETGVSGNEIARSKNPAANPNFPFPPVPVPIYKYDENNKASLMPFLVWHTVPDAVCYEVEILNAPPEIEGGISPSKLHQLEITRSIFTNGYRADLRKYKDEKQIFWRVRPLGLHLEPIGEFCNAEEIVIDEEKEVPNCPLINNFDHMPNFRQPIYPVYDWIPLQNAKKYEIELSDKPPKIENDSDPNPDAVWRQITQDMSSCYDEYGRPYAGAYYWRVRALDEKNNPIGTWSKSEKFIVEDYTDGVEVAIFGDSISHGGGSVSYSPASLEYSYGTYLDFPSVNISRSGDTSRTSVERFERDVLPLKPRNLIILTGSNSLRSSNFSAEDIISDLSEIGRLCRKNNIRPIFLTLMPLNPDAIKYVFSTPTDPNWRNKLHRVNKFIKEQQYHIDIEPYFYDSRGEMDVRLAVDGLHPGIRGKMIIGEEINLHKDLFDFSDKPSPTENFSRKFFNFLRRL